MAPAADWDNWQMVNPRVTYTVLRDGREIGEDTVRISGEQAAKGFHVSIGSVETSGQYTFEIELTFEGQNGADYIVTGECTTNLW